MWPDDEGARRPWPPTQREPVRGRPPQRPASWPDYAPNPPKKKRPKQRSPWPTLLVIMLVLGVGFGGAGYVGLRWMQGQAATPINEGAGPTSAGASTSTSSRVGSAAIGRKPRVLALDKAARDGDFAFKVTRIRSGAKVTYVHVVLKNIGSKPRPLVPSIQQVSGSGGKTYPADAVATTAASKRLWDDVPPGKALRGIMVFRAGTTAKPFAVELHGATGSRGLVVQF